MDYEVRFTKEALKDVKKLSPKLQDKLRDIIINQILPDPQCGKKLIGVLTGFYSLRLTFQDRIIYHIDEENEVIYIHRCRTHYGE